MTLFEIALLAASGLAAGLFNALAGGGTFFTFTALVAVGLPPVVANATSAAAITPGNISSAFAYRREILQHIGRFWPLAVLSALGGLIGGWLLTQIDNASFRALVPWLILAATLLFAFSPQIRVLAQWLGRRGASAARESSGIAGLIVHFFTSIYGGFFGAGMGIVMLASLALTYGDDYHLINAAKNMASTIIQIACVALFATAGIISWPEALVVAGAAMVGGYAGVAAGRRIPNSLIRIFVVFVGSALTLYFFIRP